MLTSPGQDESAGGRDLGVLEGGEHLLDRVRRKRGVGVDGHDELGLDASSAKFCAPAFEPVLLGRPHDRRAEGSRDRRRVVGRAVVDDDDRPGTTSGLEREHGLGQRRPFVVRGDDDGQAVFDSGGTHPPVSAGDGSGGTGACGLSRASEASGVDRDDRAVVLELGIGRLQGVDLKLLQLLVVDSEADADR